MIHPHKNSKDAGLRSSPAPGSCWAPEGRRDDKPLGPRGLRRNNAHEGPVRATGSQQVGLLPLASDRCLTQPGPRAGRPASLEASGQPLTAGSGEWQPGCKVSRVGGHRATAREPHPGVGASGYSQDVSTPIPGATAPPPQPPYSHGWRPCLCAPVRLRARLGRGFLLLWSCKPRTKPGTRGGGPENVSAGERRGQKAEDQPCLQPRPAKALP